MNKISLQTSLERVFKLLMQLIFWGEIKNITIKFHVPYVLNVHIKFHSNRMLFIIQLIKLFLMHNFRSQKFKILTFFDDIIIDL